MEALTFPNPKETVTYLLTRAHGLIHYDQLAKAYYQHHVRRAKAYLRRSALLMGVSLTCSAWLMFDGPKALVVPAAVIPIMLLILKIDRKVSFHLRASTEYRLSVKDFEDLTGSDWLPEAIKTFETRCEIYGPTPVEAMRVAVSLGWPTIRG